MPPPEEVWVCKDPSPWFTKRAWADLALTQLHRIPLASKRAYLEKIWPRVVSQARQVRDLDERSLSALVRFVNSGWSKGYGQTTTAGVLQALQQYKPTSGRAKWILKNRTSESVDIDAVSRSVKEVVERFADYRMPSPDAIISATGPSLSKYFTYREYFGVKAASQQTVSNAKQVLALADQVRERQDQAVSVALGFDERYAGYRDGTAVALRVAKTWKTSTLELVDSLGGGESQGVVQLTTRGQRADIPVNEGQNVTSHSKFVGVRSLNRSCNVDPRPIWLNGRPNHRTVIDYLDVTNNARYIPNEGKTYCNIYAQDFATCMGLYMPRQYAGREIGASALPSWLMANAAHYAKIGPRDLDAIKSTARHLHAAVLRNNTIGVISCCGPNVRGHVTIVLPEPAADDTYDFLPQSQTGRTPLRLFHKMWYTDGLYDTRVFALLKRL